MAAASSASDLRLGGLDHVQNTVHTKLCTLPIIFARCNRNPDDFFFFLVSDSLLSTKSAKFQPWSPTIRLKESSSAVSRLLRISKFGVLSFYRTSLDVLYFPHRQRHMYACHETSLPRLTPKPNKNGVGVEKAKSISHESTKMVVILGTAKIEGRQDAYGDI